MYEHCITMLTYGNCKDLYKYYINQNKNRSSEKREHFLYCTKASFMHMHKLTQCLGIFRDALQKLTF